MEKYLTILINACVLISGCANQGLRLSGEFQIPVADIISSQSNLDTHISYATNDSAIFYFTDDGNAYYKYIDGSDHEPYYSKLKLTKIGEEKFLLDYDLYSKFENYNMEEISDSRLPTDSFRLIFHADEPANATTSIILNDTLVLPIHAEMDMVGLKIVKPVNTIRLMSFEKPAIYSDKYVIKDRTTNTIYIKYKYFYVDRFIWPIDTNAEKFKTEVKADLEQYKNCNFSNIANRKIRDTLEIINGKVYYNHIKLNKLGKNEALLSPKDLGIFQSLRK